MIQSKNKFLPTLYIRKCKITYLECFAIILTDGCYGQLFSFLKAWHYSCTLYTNVRIHGWVDGRMMDGQTNHKDQAGALWGTLRERTRTTSRWMYALRIDVGKQIYMEHRKTARETIVYVRGLACVSDSVISELEAKKKRNLTERNSCPQHQLPEEILPWGFWFPPSSYESCVGKFKSVHPMELHTTQRNNL